MAKAPAKKTVDKAKKTAPPATVTKKKSEDWMWIPASHKGAVVKTEWMTALIPEGDVCCPRIRQVDKTWFSCYRNGGYLGHEKTLEAAQKRCRTNAISKSNEEVKEWEKAHPGELPPFLELSDEERKVHRHHNPPRAGATAAARSTAGVRPPEDPATRRIREQLEATGKGARKAAKQAAKAELSGTLQRTKDGNPKKAGTGAHDRWEFMFSFHGKTVDDYAAKKGNMTTLENAIKAGYIKLEGGK